MIPFLRHFCMHIQGEKDIKKYITLKLIYWNYLSVRLCPLSRGTQLLFLISASFSNIFLSDLLSILTQQTYCCFIKKDEIWRIIDLIKISKYCWNKHAEESAHKLSIKITTHLKHVYTIWRQNRFTFSQWIIKHLFSKTREWFDLDGLIINSSTAFKACPKVAQMGIWWERHCF